MILFVALLVAIVVRIFWRALIAVVIVGGLVVVFAGVLIPLAMLMTPRG